MVAQTTLFEFPPFGNPTGGVIYASSDSGTTWIRTSAPTNLPWVGIAASADGRRVVAVTYTNGIYTSADFGTNWTKTSAISAIPWSAVASSADGVKLFAGFSGSSDGGIYSSTNAGVTWTRTSAPNESWLSIAASADGGRVIAAPYSGLVYASTNSGRNWYPTPLPNQVWGVVAASADGNRLTTAAFGGLIYSSTNAGLTWTTASAQQDNWYPVACSADAGKLFAGGGADVLNNLPGPIYASYSTQAPLLNITASATGAIVGWTVPSTDFVLQQSSDLTSTNWTDVPGTPVLNFTNLQFQMALPGATSGGFYRLSQR
jgi:hypothetical protein